MTEIDQNTGLPALPEEGMFFRVTMDGVQLRRKLPDSEWQDASNLFYTGKPENTQDSEYRVTERSHPRWFRTYVTTTIERRRINQSEILAVAKTAKTGKKNVRHDPYTRDPILDHIYNPITREDLPRLAQEALDKYLAKEEQRSLLGDYPPKRFDLDSASPAPVD